MDYKKYEKTDEFERNSAVFVLFSVDGVPVEQIAQNFNLDANEVKNIITVHEKYEALMKD